MIQPKRITQAPAQSWIGVEYATINPFSVQNKWLLLLHSDTFFHLYTGEGEYVRRLPFSASSEPRWDSTNPNVMYYLTGNTIQSYDAMTHESRVVQIFSEYVPLAAGDRHGVQGLGEGDIENNVWALAGMRADGKRDVFLYDVKNARKGKVLVLEATDALPTTQHSGRAHGFDNIYATPSGNCQIGWYAQGKNRFQGIELYDKDMNFLRQLATVMAHNDAASYQGHDVLIWGSSADAAINRNAIFAIDNQTGQKRELLDLIGWPYAYHVSACSRDFAIVSTYAPDNSRPSQLLKVKLDGSGSEVICDTGSAMMKNEQGGMAYNPSPRASVSRDGSRVVFNSNGGDTSRGPGYVDVFMVKLEPAAEPIKPPTPEPPIVVQPIPDRTGEVTALQQTIAKMADRQQLLEQQMVVLADTLTRSQHDGTRLVEEKRALDQRIDQLTNALVKAEEQWKTTRFIDAEVGRQWQFKVRPDRLLDMADVLPGGILAPVTTWTEGNEYKFKAVRAPNGEEAFEFQERTTNK